MAKVRRDQAKTEDPSSGGDEAKAERREGRAGRTKAERRQARTDRMTKAERRQAKEEAERTASIEGRLARIEEALTAQTARNEELLEKVDAVLDAGAPVSRETGEQPAGDRA